MLGLALLVSGLVSPARIVSVGPNVRGEVTVIGVGRIGPSCMGYVVGCGGVCRDVEGSDVDRSCRDGGESIRRRLECVLGGVDGMDGGCEFARISTNGVDCDDSPTSDIGVCAREARCRLSSWSLTTSDNW